MGFLLLEQFSFLLSRNHITFQAAERKGCTEIDLASATSVLDLEYLHNIRGK